MKRLGMAFFYTLVLTSGCTTYQKVMFESQPEGAYIYVNGIPMGQAPTAARLVTDAAFTSYSYRRHDIVAKLAGYHDEALTLQSPSVYWNNTKPFPRTILLHLEPIDRTASPDNTQIASVGTERARLPPRSFPRRNIAVANLDAHGLPAAEVLTLSESLRVNLLNTDYFIVVSRSDMTRILEEQEWQRSSCSDTECLVEMGKLLSAEKIIGGTVGRVGDTFSVAVRMVDVESGRIDHSVMRNISGREDALLDAVAQLANELARQYAESRK